jgi:hypothetical protein
VAARDEEHGFSGDDLAAGVVEVLNALHCVDCGLRRGFAPVDCSSGYATAIAVTRAAVRKWPGCLVQVLQNKHTVGLVGYRTSSCALFVVSSFRK